MWQINCGRNCLFNLSKYVCKRFLSDIYYYSAVISFPTSKVSCLPLHKVKVRVIRIMIVRACWSSNPLVWKCDRSVWWGCWLCYSRKYFSNAQFMLPIFFGLFSSKFQVSLLSSLVFFCHHLEAFK